MKARPVPRYALASLVLVGGMLAMHQASAAELRDAIALAAGDAHTCILTGAGGVKCWGLNNSGQLGDGTTTRRLAPVDASGLTSGVVAVTAGTSHTCALTASGGVKCWGDNSNGQLGDGTTTRRLVPTDVRALTSGIAAVSAGNYHTCVVTGAGAVACWGYNGNGQLGDGTTTDQLGAANVVGLGARIAQVAAGGFHTCALTTGGGIKCWGGNDSGQLGDSTTTQRLAPVDVTGLAAGVASVAAGTFHTCARTNAGAVKCWGDNMIGQIGDTSNNNQSAPVDTYGLSSGVTGITTGLFHSCAVLNTGEVRCWGSNGFGQLGDGTFTTAFLPVTVSGLTNGNIVQAGATHTCAIVALGAVRCWGYDLNGQLGDNASTERLLPTAVSSLGGSAAAITAGAYHTCALLATGEMKCWGNNTSGQIGDGTTLRRPRPVSVSAGTVLSMSAGANHTCAITNAGTTKCWGENSAGQLGDGTIANRSAPVLVIGLTSPLGIVAGYYHTCAITTAGGAKCWGDNSSGQLGDGTTTSRTSPVDVSGLTSGVVALSAGVFHTCALTNMGGVKCWGASFSGQLGNGTLTQSNVAVDVSGLASGVAAISSGAYHTCALRNSGGVKCWGGNNSDQLGDGSYTDRPVPVDVVGLASGAAGVAAGSAHSCALLANGGIKCWGANANGQVGDGTTIERPTPVDVLALDGPASTVKTGAAHTCTITSVATIKIPPAVRCWGYNYYGEIGDGTTYGRPLPVAVQASARSMSN